MEDNLFSREATGKIHVANSGGADLVSRGTVCGIYPVAALAARPGQFIASSALLPLLFRLMALSVLVALILTPALCATLLKPVSAEHHEKAASLAGSIRV